VPVRCRCHPLVQGESHLVRAAQLDQGASRELGELVADPLIRADRHDGLENEKDRHGGKGDEEGSTDAGRFPGRRTPAR